MASLNTEIVSKSFLKQLRSLMEQVETEYEMIHSLAPVSEKTKKDSRVLENVINQYSTLWNSVYSQFSTDYKESQIILLKRYLTLARFKKIGLDLLQSNQVEKPTGNHEFIQSIDLQYWNKIQSYLLTNANFQGVLHKLTKKYTDHVNHLIDDEIHKITIPVDNKIKNEYRKAYYKSPLTFEAFLNQMQPIESISKDDNLKPTSQGPLTDQIRSQYTQALEKKKNEVMKQEQQQSFDNYESYLSMDDRELAKAKRQGTLQRRTVMKKSRREKFGDGD